jgi:uracil-DNA glycosylase
MSVAAPLDDPLEVARRRALLLRPAMRPLAVFAAHLRAELREPVPDVDPCDGGTAAPVLMLLERPGLGALGAGFVSRDNATPTARNIRRFTETAGLQRNETVIWNVVPWAGADARGRNQAPRPDELRAGLGWLPPFLALLPRLSVAVLAGRVARLAAETLERERPRLRVLAMPHPSPTIVCTHPRIRVEILSTLQQAASALRTETAS